MFPMKRLMLLPSVYLPKLHGYPMTRFQFSHPFPSQSYSMQSLSLPTIQHSTFATSASTKKSGTKKKTTTKKTTTKKTAAKKKTTAKKKAAAAKKKKAATKKKKAAAKKKTTKRKKKKVVKKKKPKPFLKTLSKPDQKLLKRFPDPKRPARPMSGYNTFVSEQFGNNIGMTIPQAAQSWRELSESEKQAYKDRVQTEVNEYKAAVKEYNKRKEENLKEWYVIIRELRRQRPPRSGYIGFIQENKSIFQQYEGVERGRAGVKDLAVQWKQMSDYDREAYNDKYSGLYQDWKNRVDSFYN